MTITRLPHIVCFAPYTTWSIHSARQITILQSLRLRGCSVSYVTCDAVFSDCDVLQAASGAPKNKPANACLICQSSVAARLASWGMPYRWLGRWLSSADFAAAARWAHGLRPHELTSATFQQWPLGTWMSSSVHVHLRQNVLDPEAPATVAIFKSYLYSGALAALGFSRLLEEEKPDLLLLFNGRMGVMRSALEIGKAKGIRVLVEERGHMPGHLTLFRDTHCLDGRGLSARWEDWKDVPLSIAETQTLAGLFEERWSGQKDTISFVYGFQKAEETRAALRLDKDKPVLALFTSNLDEVAGIGLKPGKFATHDAWVVATVDFARRNPQVQLVIRVHPASGSRRSMGTNQQELAFYDHLSAQLPANVRLVRSDENVHSYSLANLANLTLTWHSTIGLEVAALGKPVIRSGSEEINPQPSLPSPADPADYDRLLAEFLNGHVPDALEMARSAWRFGYLAYYRDSFPFPLVKQTDWYIGDMNYDEREALLPGKDTMLDRICDHVISGLPLHPDPPHRGEDMASAEIDYITRWIASARPGEPERSAPA